MEAFLEKALKSFCVNGPASCSDEGPWTQDSRNTIKMLIVKTEGECSVHQCELYVIFNCLHRLWKQWEIERTNSVTWTRRYMNSPCRWRAVNRLSHRPEGTLFASPLSSDAQSSVKTSGGVCELTPLSQGNLTFVCSLRVAPFQENTKRGEARGDKFSWQRHGVMLQPR